MERSRTSLSLLGSFWALLVRPRQLFATIAEGTHRGWWLAALVILVATVLPPLVSWPMVAREAREAFLKMQEEMMRNAPPGAAPSDLDQAAQFVASPLFTLVIPSITMVVGQVLSWLIWAAALYLVVLVLGARVAFGQLFQATVWATLPVALRGFVQSLYIGLSGQLIRNPGLSGLVPLPQPDFAANMSTPVIMPDVRLLLLRQVLQGIDIFLIWRLALLALGLSVLARFSLRRSGIVVIALWIVFSGISLLPTLISQWFLQTTMGAGFSATSP